MNRLLMLAGLVALTVSPPLCALAQTQPTAPAPTQSPAPAPTQSPAPTQPEERMLVGQVQSVDESGTELTLADGTKLLTPPGAQLNSEALEKGMVVVALYREQDDGRKVLTGLTRGRSEPAPDAPKRPEQGR